MCYLLSDGPGLTIECPLWSLHVDEAEEGGGGISVSNVDELADSDLGSDCHGSLQ